MKTRPRHYLTASLTCLFCCACSTQKKSAIQVPESIIAVTNAQKRLLNNIQSLSTGMSTSEVKSILGPPEEEYANSLFYNLAEDGTNGGYYITVRLIFDADGLTDAEVRDGEITLAPRP
ncbi:MAG: hypothetical protein JXR40_11085 [Pontiellaceae bacterium]|nr:hypothetical protein [Pontiellaceae bacterium]